MGSSSNGGGSMLPTQNWRAAEAERQRRFEADENFVSTHGLRSHDELIVDWVNLHDLSVRGCQIVVRRGGKRLLWRAKLIQCDPSGCCVYAPFLKSEQAIRSFVSVFASACGFEPHERRDRTNRLQFVLSEVVTESRRVIAGDLLTFDLSRAFSDFQIERTQRTVDMELYSPLAGASEGRIVLNSSLGCRLLPHHPFTIARMIVESNRLMLEMGRGCTFWAISRP